jgi:hypothetical protein
MQAEDKWYKKKVVVALCSIIKEDKDDNGNITREFWKCPFHARCNLESTILKDRMHRVPSQGFTNLYRHLCKCADGEDELTTRYEAAIQAAAGEGVEANRAGNLHSFLKPKVSKYVEGMYGWLKWIINKNMPLSAVEDDEHRKFSTHKLKTTAETIVRMINHLSEIVEGRVRDDFNKVQEHGGKMCIMHDGWTSQTGEHLAGVFGAFCLPTKGIIDKVECTVWSPRIVLLGCSTMDHHEVTDGDGDPESSPAVTFNAKQYAEYITETLEYYDLPRVDKRTDYNSVQLDPFIACQVCDNAAVNKKIGDILHLPTVGCNNHKLNLEVERFIKDNCPQLLASVRETMVALKNSCKFMARLKKKTKYRPYLYNDTRWYGKYFMLKRYWVLYDFIVEINAEISAVEKRNPKLIPLNTTSIPNIKAEVLKYADFLEHFHNTHMDMEKRYASLSWCRTQLDAWVTKEAEPNTTNPDDLYGNLNLRWIKQDSSIVKDKNFESGVVKIQRKEFGNLTAAERWAVRCLLVDPTAAVAADDSDNDGPNVLLSPRSIAREEQAKRQRIQAAGNDTYINADFILGSVAEVERLWSLSRYVLQDHRTCMYPINFECIMFLKINSQYWDIKTVEQACEELGLV